eukprot:comp23052_c0_seq1/m.36909 comp23052_c0_seq1/g.36909  ORF comp23052_c0_seq1/g.36909 comp23052_c0_seq1/m.36909 type:complete len:157 (-) comp23052_c0_seq1:537-1007(-)
MAEAVLAPLWAFLDSWHVPQDGLLPQAAAFLRELPWDEGWLQGVCVCHVLCLVLVLATRHWLNLQTALFCLLGALGCASEQVNTWCAHNWRRFARAQYFDSQGLFVIAVYTLPILANLLVMILSWLHLSVGYMVTVKRSQLRGQQPRGSSDTKKVR